MTIQYFEDTDTLYIALKSTDVAAIHDLDENTLIEFDAHARERAGLPDISFQKVAVVAPA
jgi:hypothetical protein